MKSKFIKSILFPTIGLLSASAITPIVLSSCGKKQPVFPVTGIKIIQGDLGLLESATAKLDAVVLPENASNQNVIWSSSDESVATVDQNGNVTAVTTGVFGNWTATITARTVEGGYSATRVVTVTHNSEII